MKTTITKTVTETQITCDHCGKEVVYSEQSCVVCGKCACHDCFLDHLVEMRLDGFPRFWPSNQGISTFNAYACRGCHNKVTRRFDAVKSRTERRNAQCEKWSRWYRDQMEILNEWKNKAEEKR